jgi:hypothetical protein
MLLQSLLSLWVISIPVHSNVPSTLMMTQVGEDAAEGGILNAHLGHMPEALSEGPAVDLKEEPSVKNIPHKEFSKTSQLLNF